MAFVVLPCDLPLWNQLEDYIERITSCRYIDDLTRQMRNIYDLCDVSLEPEDEPIRPKSNIFSGLEIFLREDFSDLERQHFFDITLPVIVESALNLKNSKPRNGLQFSLQQEVLGSALNSIATKLYLVWGTYTYIIETSNDSLGLLRSRLPLESAIEITRDFAASLIAHAFFSTFPRRTDKTHPTLQDFNFGKFFRHLHRNYQKSKLKSVFRYFDLTKRDCFPILDSILLTRRVTAEDQISTIDDWFGCDLPLCGLGIKRDNRVENADTVNSLFVCFSSRKPGGSVLADGKSLECIRFATCPELLVTLLMVEALDANEALFVEKLILASTIRDGVLAIDSESDEPGRIKLLDACLVNASDYRHSPATRCGEDAVLGELNKAFLGFAGPRSPRHPRHRRYGRAASPAARLSPIGESCGATPLDDRRTRSPRGDGRGGPSAAQHARRRRMKTRRYATAEEWPAEGRISSGPSTATYPTDEQLVVGVAEGLVGEVEGEGEGGGAGQFEWRRASCDANARGSPSATTEFYSAADSWSDAEYDVNVDDDDDDDEEEEEEEEGLARRYSGQLETVESRNSFAERLRAALRRAASVGRSNESNYAVDISVTGSSVADPNIRMRRGGSRGFMLENDSSDEDISAERREKNSRFHARDPTNELFVRAVRKITSSRNSSEYSFSTDCESSDLAEVCDQLNRWLSRSQDDDDGDGYWLQQKLREEDAINRFARSLLKRALSESFVGVELTDGDRRLSKVFAHHRDEDEAIGGAVAAAERTVEGESTRVHADGSKLKMAVRSLSLELVKRNHRLASRSATGCCGPDSATGRSSVTDDSRAPSSGLTIVTGNWGCGSHLLGDCQLKLLIQWAAASAAGASRIVYYTGNRRQLAKLDTLCRILVDRRWNVGDVMRATMYYTQRTTTANTEWKGETSDDEQRSMRSASSSVDETERLGDDVTLFDLLISSDRKIG